MTTPLHPDVWAEFVTGTHTRSGWSNLTEYRWSTRPLADAGSYEGGWKEGRIASWAPIVRALSDPQGHAEAATFGWTLRDTDHLVRGWLGGVTTEQLANREAAIKLVSAAGRAAATTPRVLARGRIKTVTLGDGLLAKFEARDIISEGFNARQGSKLLPQRTITRELFPDVHRDLIGYPQPIIYGEVSDLGALDADGVSAEKGLVPVFWVGTEEIDGVTWDRYLVAGHAVKDIHAWFASDLESPATRVKQEEATAGVDFLIPGHAGWPFETTYRDLTDSRGVVHRVTLIYAQGDVSEAHKEGHINITVNVCGIEDVGDGSGTLIRRAFRIYRHALNNWVIANDGKGYYSGAWLDLPTWDFAGPEVSLIHTESFVDAQGASEARLGNEVGYVADFALTKRLPLREVIKRFNTSFDCRLGVNHHGQFFCGFIDDTADVSAATLYRDRIEIVDLPPPTFAPEEIENRVVYVYDWDADKQKFRGDREAIGDLTMQDAQGEVRASALQEFYFVRHPETARDVAARRLLRLKRTPRYQSVVLDLAGLEQDLGELFRITHYDGIGASGYTEHPFLAVRHEVDLNAMQVTITGLDLRRIIGFGAPTLDDELGSEYEFLLGDETSQALPEDGGAFELR